MSKAPRLVRVGLIDLPVIEASGLATTTDDGQVRLLVVGDRTARVAATTLGPHGRPTEWDSFDLAALDGWPDFGNSSQFEAIAVDSGRTVAVLREDPPVVLVGDMHTHALRACLTLTAPTGSPLHGHWDDPSSRGEGLLLLRYGRLLVAKEKHPSALVEFGPVGTAPRGLSTDDFLGPEEEWHSPDGDTEYVATAMWRLHGHAGKALRDVSALGIDRDHCLWMLSDKSRSLGRLALDPPLLPNGGEIRELDELWRLPKGTTKPEGIAIVDDDRVLVATDTNSRHGNGMLIERPR